MKDIEVIHKFYEQISWVDQCHEITYGGRTMLANPYTLAVPSQPLLCEMLRERGIQNSKLSIQN
jgi:hypothetical protein